MEDESESTCGVDCTLAPDSVTENEANSEVIQPVVIRTIQSNQTTQEIIPVPVVVIPVTASIEPSTCCNAAVPESSETSSNLATCQITSVISLPSDFQLSGSSTSAFRPFVTQAATRRSESDAHNSSSSNREITSSTELPDPITSTPVARRLERTPRQLSNDMSKLPSPRNIRLHDQSPINMSGPIFLNPNFNDDNDDGRTTASAPPCTPAPDTHQQPQSPFRSNRQIKKIDLLAMSRSRQSDRAENARRDGRLAPSPRKKDEVLRNSGLFMPPPPHRHYTSFLRGNPSHLNPADDGDISLDSVPDIPINAASPNVDVVSVDDPQSDPSKCTFSIQFHDFAPAPNMHKCSLCGFVTNNHKFYRRHRRLHSRQAHAHPTSILRCSLCDFSTTQVRKMREHTISTHHLSHQHAIHNADNYPHPSLASATHRPPMQGPVLIGSSGMYQPLTSRPVTVGGAASGGVADAASLGMPTYIPARQDPNLQINPQGEDPLAPGSSSLLSSYPAPSDQQVASYMRSVLNDLMTPGGRAPQPASVGVRDRQESTGFPLDTQPPALPATSTRGGEESFNYHRLWTSSGSGSGNHLSLSGGGYVKVKAEPRSGSRTRTVHDVPSSSSHARRGISPGRRVHSLPRPPPSPPRPDDTQDSESGMDFSSDDHFGSPKHDDTDTSGDFGRPGNPHPSRVPAASGVLVDSLPFIKIEFPPRSESQSHQYSHHAHFSQSRLNHAQPSPSRTQQQQQQQQQQQHNYSDQNTQCDIISMSTSHRLGRRTQSETVSSAGGGGGSAGVESRCHFCGVTFDDEVIYSIHIGCHSHTDPFLCNVCGKQCHNKYGFYSHIMRGHQARPDT